MQVLAQDCIELVLFHLHSDLCWWIWCCGSEWRSDLGRNVSPAAPLPSLWGVQDGLWISKSLPQGILCFGWNSYIWTLNYFLLGKWIIILLLLISQKLPVPSATLLCPFLLLHTLPVNSPHIWEACNVSWELLLISSWTPEWLLCAQCSGRGGDPVSITGLS